MGTVTSNLWPALPQLIPSAVQCSRKQQTSYGHHDNLHHHYNLHAIQNQPLQCPSSNQPTQCHEARRGKCRMGGTGFRTRTMTVAYAYAAYAYVHSNCIQNHPPLYPKKCCCFWCIQKYPKSIQNATYPPKK